MGRSQHLTLLLPEEGVERDLCTRNPYRTNFRAPSLRLVVQNNNFKLSEGAFSINHTMRSLVEMSPLTPLSLGNRRVGCSALTSPPTDLQQSGLSLPILAEVFSLRYTTILDLLLCLPHSLLTLKMVHMSSETNVYIPPASKCWV